MSPDPVAEPPRPQSEETLKFTIVTVTYNAADLIERTIESVEKQDYPRVEHVIIDGNSQDSTFALIQHYLERNSLAAHRHEIIVRSEPDEGLYDAMNKALQLATGDYILYLNAGDTLHADDTLTRLAAAAEGTSEANRPAVIYGHTDIVDNAGHFLRHRRLEPPERLTWKSFRSGMLVCHQSFAALTAVAQQFPYRMEKYRYSADFDWCIRIMREAARQKRPLIAARQGDGQMLVVTDYLDSDDSLTQKHHKASLRERFRIMASHYGLISTSLRHAWFVVRAAIKK